jgi:hypothetical protein
LRCFFMVLFARFAHQKQNRNINRKLISIVCNLIFQLRPRITSTKKQQQKE